MSSEQQDKQPLAKFDSFLQGGQQSNQKQEEEAAAGLFGDDDDDDDNQQNNNNQQQLQQYDLGLDDEDADDILGLDDGMNDGEVPADHEGSLLMRFCPHDSSMLYPKVSVEIRLYCLCDIINFIQLNSPHQTLFNLCKYQY